MKNIICCNAVLCMGILFVSIPIIGFDTSLICGLAIGFASVSVNFFLLKLALDDIVRGKRLFFGLIIYIFRLVLYGITIWYSCRIGLLAAIGYGISSIGIPISSGIVFSRKGGLNGKL